MAGVALIAASLAASSWAASGTYWGHDNLSDPNPPRNTCPNAAAGIACTGWNYWDESDAHWHSGHGRFVVGFICGDDGVLWGPAHGDYEPFDTYGAWWSTWCITHYNRVAVAHIEPSPYGTYNYLHAFWQIW